MILRIEFSTDNAAFQDNAFEVASVLEKLAEQLDDEPSADDSGTIRDSNGNTIGGWTWSES